MTAPTTHTQLVEQVASGTPVDVPRDWWVYAGAHGGLVAAMLEASARRATERSQLVSLRVQYHRPVRTGVRAIVDDVREGRTATTVAVALLDADDRRLTTATVVLDDGNGTPGGPAFAPPVPDAEEPEDLAAVPPLAGMEGASILDHVDIRPVGGPRPFAGGHDAVLWAWLRLLDVDGPPDTAGLCVLLDALAPAVTAVLSGPAAVPTVELGIRPTGVATIDPWVLIEARATAASDQGWVHERIDAWDRNGTHLASSDQLRLLQLLPNGG